MMALHQHSKRIYFIAVLMVCLALQLNARKPQWQGNTGWEFSEPKEQQQQRSLEDYECSIDEQCDMLDNDGRMIETNEVPLKRKANTGFPTVASYDMDTRSAVMPFFHTSRPCSCYSDSSVEDLGPSYHPRYLPSVVCNAEACGGGPLRCHQRRYQVRVLTRRDVNNVKPDPNSVQLPESLRKNWMFETIPITVACECHP